MPSAASLDFLSEGPPTASPVQVGVIKLQGDELDSAPRALLTPPPPLALLPWGCFHIRSGPASPGCQFPSQLQRPTIQPGPANALPSEGLIQRPIDGSPCQILFPDAQLRHPRPCITRWYCQLLLLFGTSAHATRHWLNCPLCFCFASSPLLSAQQHTTDASCVPGPAPGPGDTDGQHGSAPGEFTV